jgi:hypothetical protein
VAGHDEKEKDRQDEALAGTRRQAAVTRCERMDNGEQAPQPKRHDRDERSPGEVRVQESRGQDRHPISRLVEDDGYGDDGGNGEDHRKEAATGIQLAKPGP